MAVYFADKLRQYALTTSFEEGDLRGLAVSHLSKWIVEEGASPGAWLPVDIALTPTNVKPLSKVVLAWLADKVRAAPLNPNLLLALKTGTNHGDPTWRTSLLDQAIHLLMAAECKTPDDVLRVIAEARAITGSKLQGGPVISNISRTGPIGKAQPLYGWANGVMSVLGSTRGYYPRFRQVRGVANFYNECMRRPLLSIMYRLKAWWPYGHSGSGPVLIRKLLAMVRGAGAEGSVVSDDLSGFDLSASTQHMEQLADFYDSLEPGVGALYRLSIKMPILGGPLVEGDRAAVYARSGGIVSGLISTALDGTVINIVRVVMSIAAGLNISEAECCRMFDSMKWSGMFSSDDSLLVVPRRCSFERYVAESASLGYTCKLEKYPVFLMTWLDCDRGIQHGLASRALMRTLATERGHNGPHSELAAAFIRWARCVEDPTFDELWALAADNPLWTEFGVASFRDLKRLAESPDFQARVASEIGASPDAERKWAQLAESLLFAGGGTTAGHPDGPAFLLKLGGLRAYAAQRKSFEEITEPFAHVDWRVLLADTERQD